ncbi:hypothetical protein Kisp01_18250 [Kineosporia sp. NBRC 101677]|nr:hypothetical protein Kisp01_18250 [Kineosporia sp. NBRC 101677]
MFRHDRGTSRYASRVSGRNRKRNVGEEKTMSADRSGRWMSGGSFGDLVPARGGGAVPMGCADGARVREA